LHTPVITAPDGPEPGAPAPEPVALTPVPYAEWANRGVTTMRIRFPTI
jgi:hypothetical protein